MTIYKASKIKYSNVLSIKMILYNFIIIYSLWMLHLKHLMLGMVIVSHYY